MEKVKTAVIGIGNMGTAHAQSLWDDRVPGLALAAVCDTDPARLAYAAKAWPGVACYASEDALLAAGGVQAAIVAVPHPLHSKIASLALAAGLHVLVEKPLDVRLSVAQALCAQAKASGKVFALMLNQRTNPLFAKARAIVQGGQLGQLKRSVWIITNWYRTQHYYDSGAWRATWAGEGGGVLLNQAPHNLDLWQWICGMPERVCCHMHFGSHRAVSVEDDVTAYLEFPNGATGVFVSCTHDVLGTDRLELLLDGGKIIVEDSCRARIRRLHQMEQELSAGMDAQQTARLVEGGELPDICTETVLEHNPEWAAQHCEMLADFVNAAQTGTPCTAPGAEGLNEVQLANAMYVSAWQGRAVTLPVDEAAFSDMLAERARSEAKKNNTRKE